MYLIVYLIFVLYWLSGIDDKLMVWIDLHPWSFFPIEFICIRLYHLKHNWLYLLNYLCRYVMLNCNDIFKLYYNRKNRYSEFYVSIILFDCFDCYWWCISSRIKLISMLIIDYTYYSIYSKNLKEKEGWNQDRWNSRWNWNWIL